MEKNPARSEDSARPPIVTCDVALTDAFNAVYALNIRLHALFDRIVGAEANNVVRDKDKTSFSLFALLNDGPVWLTESCAASLDVINEIERALYGDVSNVQR